VLSLAPHVRERERVCVAKKAASNPRRTDGIKWVAIPIIEPPRKRSPTADGEVRRRALAPALLQREIRKWEISLGIEFFARADGERN